MKLLKADCQRIENGYKRSENEYQKTKAEY